ncbi:MAG: rhodanese [Planctomycetes bacterium]|nr:rhodanese [Planctomycetota bacterium]
MTPGEAKRRLAVEPRPVLLDCRTPEEHAIARIEGAVLVPMNEVAARLGEMEPWQDSAVIVYCHHGVRSLRVTAFLRQNGFENVVSMAGGIDRWSVEVDAGVGRY